MRLQHVEIKLSDGRVGLFTGREFVAPDGPATKVVAVTFHEAMDVEGVAIPADKAEQAKVVEAPATPPTAAPADPAIVFGHAVEEILKEHARPPKKRRTPRKKAPPHAPKA